MSARDVGSHMLLSEVSVGYIFSFAINKNA